MVLRTLHLQMLTAYYVLAGIAPTDGVRRSVASRIERSSGVPGIPRQGGQAVASIHFSDGGGGGGVTNFGALRAQSRNI